MRIKANYSPYFAALMDEVKRLVLLFLHNFDFLLFFFILLVCLCIKQLISFCREVFIAFIRVFLSHVHCHGLDIAWLCLLGLTRL